MKKYEFQMIIADKDYLDQLIVGLVHQGYAPYLGFDDSLVIEIPGDELIEIEGTA